MVKYVKYSDIWGGEFVKIVTKKGGKNGSKVKKGHLGRSALGALRQFMFNKAQPPFYERRELFLSFRFFRF